MADRKISAIAADANAAYWSSSDNDANGAWYQYFSYGDQYDGGKNYTVYVRPVRAFS